MFLLSRTVLGYSRYVYLCQLINLLRFSSWHFLCCRYNLLQSINAIFCANRHVQFHGLCCVIQSDMLPMYHFPTHLFFSFDFSFTSVSTSGIVSVATVSGSLAVAYSWCGFHYGCYSHSLDPLFSGPGLHLSFSGTWLSSVCDTYIAL